MLNISAVARPLSRLILKNLDMLITKSIHILCFGDSLTAGWMSGTMIYHPYNESMVEKLQKSLPTIDFTTDVQGLPGDQVASPPGRFVPRMGILCKYISSLSYY